MVSAIATVRAVVRGGCPYGFRQAAEGGCGRVLVEGSVAEHGEEDVAAASGEGDEGLVVALAFGAFAVVVGPRRRVVQGGEGGEEQGAFEFLVARAGWVLAADGGAGAPGDRGDAGVGGQVSGGGEVLAGRLR